MICLQMLNSFLVVPQYHGVVVLFDSVECEEARVKLWKVLAASSEEVEVEVEHRGSR